MAKSGNRVFVFCVVLKRDEKLLSDAEIFIVHSDWDAEDGTELPQGALPPGHFIARPYLSLAADERTVIEYVKGHLEECGLEFVLANNLNINEGDLFEELLPTQDVREMERMVGPLDPLVLFDKLDELTLTSVIEMCRWGCLPEEESEKEEPLNPSENSEGP